MKNDVAIREAHAGELHRVGTMESPLKRLRTALTEPRVYGAIIVCIIAGVWLPALGKSFEIDETGTVWVISGGLREIVHRSIHFPQSIAYCLIAWGAAQIGQVREVALRVPSVLAGIGAILLLYKFVARMANKATAALACLLWVLMPAVTGEATQARPYMFCAFATMASYGALISWLESRSTRRLVWFAFLAALPAYFSYFLVLVPATQIIYLIAASRDWNLRFRTVACLATLVGFLELPLLYPALIAARDRHLHTFLTTPDPSSLVYAVIPNAIAYGLLASIGLYLLLRIAWKYHPVEIPAKIWLLVSMWSAIPIIVLLTVSLFTPTKCFLERYFIESFAGLAIIYALLLRGFEPALMRITATVATAVFAIGGLGPPPDFWHMKRFDFRDASQFLSAYRRTNDLATFTHPWFAEGTHLPFPLSPEDESCLLAPFLAYPAGGHVSLLPQFENSGTEGYVRTSRAFFETTTQDFLMYGFSPNDLPQWLANTVQRRFDAEVLHTALDVPVVRFRLRMEHPSNPVTLSTTYDADKPSRRLYE